jgi:tetratricopeptide (TPR) repeat protein
MNPQVTFKRMIALVVVVVITLALNLLVSSKRAKAQGQVQVTPADSSAQTSADPSGPNALLDQANRLSRAERWDQAVQLYLQALRVDPSNATIQNNLGYAEAMLGNLPEAVEAFMQAVKLEPKYAACRYNLGNVYLKLNKVDPAIEQLSKAIELKPDYAEAHSDLGNAFAEKGLYSRAISELNRALLSKPDFAAAENNLGTVFFNLKKYKEAARHFGRAAQLTPDSFKPNYNLGVANLMRCSMSQSLADLEHNSTSRACFVRCAGSALPNIAGNFCARARHQSSGQIRAAITSRGLVQPLIAFPPSLKSIQPSLKPSSIRIRGTGFFIPCEVNNSCQDSRSTGTARTGFPSTVAKASARSFGFTRLGPSNSTTRMLDQSS